MNICKKLFGKKNYIRFYCFQPGIKELYPIAPISSLKRSWIEDSPIKEETKDSSFVWTQNCPAIKKIMNTGFVVKSPIDFQIETKFEGEAINWKSSTSLLNDQDFISIHSKEQSELIFDDKDDVAKGIIKVNLPWKFECSDDIIFLMMPIKYNNEKRFYSATGILDGRYTNDINVQLFWRIKDGNSIIEAGTPLCQIIPIKRKDLILSNYNIVIEDATKKDILNQEKIGFSKGCKFSSYNNFGKKIALMTKMMTSK